MNNFKERIAEFKTLTNTNTIDSIHAASALAEDIINDLYAALQAKDAETAAIEAAELRGE